MIVPCIAAVSLKINFARLHGGFVQTPSNPWLRAWSVSRMVITTRSCTPYSLVRRITADLAQCPQSADLIVVLVHTEVHMLTPHPEGKDADALLATAKSLDTCTTIWRESEVLNFGGLVNASISRMATITSGRTPCRLLRRTGVCIIFRMVVVVSSVCGGNWIRVSFVDCGGGLAYASVSCSDKCQNNSSYGWHYIAKSGRTF